MVHPHPRPAGSRRCPASAAIMAWAAAALLVACGGSGTEAQVQGLAASPPPVAAQGPAGLAEGAVALVAAAGDSRRRIQAVSTGSPRVPTAEELFAWAQKAYPTYFPGNPVTQTWAPYTYRDYGNGNYLGVAQGEVWVLGPVAGSSTTPVSVGAVADYACQVFPAACGHKHVFTPTVAGLVREYIVYVPWRSIGVPNLPAVFMFHGTSGDGERFFDISGWREKADETGLIAVFPSALTHCFYEDDITRNGVFEANERKLTTKWAAGKLGDPAVRPLCTAAQMADLSPTQRARADHPLADDMTFFSTMVNSLVSDFQVDAKRVYVSGFSNGAEFTGRLATEASTRVAAAACASSVVSVDTLAARPMSVVHSVGELDPDQSAALGYTDGAIPLTEDLTGNPRWNNGVVLPFITTQQLANSYTYSQVMANGRLTSRFQYASSTAGASNVFHSIVVQGLAHEYPNGKNHPIRLADELWDFFRERRLP